MFSACLHAIAFSDEPFMREYMETSFVDKVLKTNFELAKNNLFLDVHRDIEGDDNLFVTNFCEVIDGIVIKGLSTDRQQNGNEEDFHFWTDLDDMGIAIYTDKKYSNPENFVNPKENKQMFENFENIIIRVLVKIKTPLVLNIMKEDVEGKSMDQIFTDDPQGEETVEDLDRQAKHDIYKNKQSSNFILFELYLDRYTTPRMVIKIKIIIN